MVRVDEGHKLLERILDLLELHVHSRPVTSLTVRIEWSSFISQSKMPSPTYIREHNDHLNFLAMRDRRQTRNGQMFLHVFAAAISRRGLISFWWRVLCRYLGQLISPHLIFYHFISFCVISIYFTSLYAIFYYFMSFHIISYRFWSDFFRFDGTMRNGACSWHSYVKVCALVLVKAQTPMGQVILFVVDGSAFAVQWWCSFHRGGSWYICSAGQGGSERTQAGCQ